MCYEKGRRGCQDARKETVLHIPPPETPKQVREFLGTAGFCRLWIPGFAEMAAPLYPLTKARWFSWGEEEHKAFDAIKLALMSAPALGLPDVTKPFHLLVQRTGG